MDDCVLPLREINSPLPIAVYSESHKQLISAHATRGAALHSLSAYVQKEPLTDAAIYERFDGWRCILRCPCWHAKWVDEATKRLAVD
jgi:hypothetical protein